MARIEEITFSKNYIEVQHEEFSFKAFAAKNNLDIENYAVVSVQVFSQALNCWISADNGKAYAYAREILEKALNQVKEEKTEQKENEENENY